MAMRIVSCSFGGRIEVPKVDAFLTEIEALCRKHGLSLSHEDGHGAFIVEAFSQENIDWLQQAFVGKTTPLP